MDITELLRKEASFLSAYQKTAISISTTAKDATDFKVLPRRYANHRAISCFLINSLNDLKKVIDFFDGQADCFFVDTEAKQSIHLYHEAKSIVQTSKLVSIKPNDVTLEACDLLLRYYFKDDLYGKRVLVIGTGNLASKLALRASERGANVWLTGRSIKKTKTIAKTLNMITPQFSPEIKVFDYQDDVQMDAVISFLSGAYWDEELLINSVGNHTYIIDGGIGNFSKEFIRKMTARKITLTRLDVRLGLLYQMLSELDDTKFFLESIYGKSLLGGVTVVSGGFIGDEGAVIVDQIKHPTQIIGIANGMGGVKEMNSLSVSEQTSIQKVKELVSANKAASVTDVQKS